MNHELTGPQRDTLKVLVEADPRLPVPARDVYRLRLGRPLTEAEMIGAGSAQAKTLERLREAGLVRRVEGEGKRRTSPGYLPTARGRIVARDEGLDDFAPLPPVRERRSAWDGRKRIRTQDEEAAIASAARLLERVVIPGYSPEPPSSAELVDTQGVVWTKDRHAGRDGWAPEGGDDLALRWTSVAMLNAAPFILMRASRRSPRTS